MTCTSPLCIRCSLNYQDFYQNQSIIKDLNAVTLMAIDLKQYQNFEKYSQSLRKNSYFLRSLKKAVKREYWVEQFQYQNYTPDMREIRRSVTDRAQGLPIDHFVLTETALNKDPAIETPIESPQCNGHWELWFGVFQQSPNHIQGKIKQNKRLVAYARLRRIGNSIKYAEFIGHGEHLEHSVMIMLHIHLIEWILNNHNPYCQGIEYVTYNNVEKGDKGILYWKRKALFKPYIIKKPEINLPKDFDPVTYLSLNPDLTEPVKYAGTHYIRHGRVENRPYKYDLPKDFDPSAYLKLNQDLTDLDIDPRLHYILHGKFEGRKYSYKNNNEYTIKQ